MSNIAAWKKQFNLEEVEFLEESTFFWIDIFAINQHPGQEQQADLGQLATAVSLSYRTLLCMDETGKKYSKIQSRANF